VPCMETITTPAPPRAQRIARTVGELELLRDAWDAFAWPRVDADPDFLAALVESIPGEVRPHVAVLERNGSPAAMLVGRIEETRLDVRFGYRTVFRPRVRLLTVAHGGLAGGDAEPAALVDEVLRLLRDGEADVALLPGLRTGSALLAEARGRPGALACDRALDSRLHRRLELPATYDEFLRSRSKSTRESVKRYSKKLERDLGDRIAFRVFSDPGEIDEMFAVTEAVAAKTYQRGLGVALADTDQSRQLVSLGLERGWFRTWVLLLDGSPVAFWPGWTYGRTFHVGTPGYDPALAEYRLGTYILMRIVSELCADPAVDAVDFGPGDSEYKRRFSTDEWQETDVLVFAPTFRAARINATRTAILRSAALARRALERLGVEQRLKRAWRRRLSSA
jgi:CelD/BcsL family acetyltransferase involved in cellulose biosynthesis